MTISHICGNWPLYFTLKNKSGPVGIEKSIFMKSVFYKSCFFWSKLQKKHCPKLQFQKIKFMKRPNVHHICVHNAMSQYGVWSDIGMIIRRKRILAGNSKTGKLLESSRKEGHQSWVTNISGAPWKNIHPQKFTPKRNYLWKIFTSEKYSPLKKNPQKVVHLSVLKTSWTLWRRLQYQNNE